MRAFSILLLTLGLAPFWATQTHATSVPRTVLRGARVATTAANSTEAVPTDDDRRRRAEAGWDCSNLLNQQVACPAFDLESVDFYNTLFVENTSLLPIVGPAFCSTTGATGYAVQDVGWEECLWQVACTYER